MPTDDLPAMFAFNRWADEAVLAAVRTLSPGDYAREPVPGWASVRATLVHMGDALDIWANRLDGHAVTRARQEADVPTLDDAERLLRAGHDAFDRLVAGMTPERLASEWEYRAIAGTRFR